MFGSRALRRLMLTTLGALLLALAIPASAAAAWGTPKYISPQFIPATGPAEVAMDSDGDSYFVYGLDGGTVQARKYSPTGALGWNKRLTPAPTNPNQEPPDAELPAVAANARGDSVYAWFTTNNAGTRSIIRVRTLSRTGTLGALHTAVDMGQSEGSVEEAPAVAIDRDGDAVVAWTRVAGANQRGTVMARTLSSAGTLGDTLTISTTDAGHSAEFGQVEMRDRGDAVFAWQHSTNNLEGLVRTRRLTPAGNLTNIRNVSRQDSTLPDFDLDGAGNAIFSWLYADPLAGGLTAQSRRMAADGTLGKFRNLSPRGGEALDVDVALSSGGAAAAAYSIKHATTGKAVVRGRPISASDALGQTQTLSGNSPDDATDAEVGISTAGRSVFSWRRYTGTTYRVESKTLTATGTLSPVRSVASGQKLFQPHLAVAPSGEAAATWLDEDLKRIGAAFGP